MTDILCAKEIKKHLLNDVNIVILESVDSTNAYLKSNADSFQNNTLIIAKKQTAGHGRYERTFYSPENSGIYMSLLLKSPIPAEKSILITTAAAVAVAKTCEKLSGKKALIKWVNDIYINERKVCGILTEGALSNDNKNLKFAVLGIGINAYTPEKDFDEEIKDIAGSVFDKIKENGRNQIIAEILNEFYKYFENLDSKSFLKEYKDKSFILGRDIKVIKSGETFFAKALDIDNNFHLVVQYETGEKEALSSGEISIKI